MYEVSIFGFYTFDLFWKSLRFWFSLSSHFLVRRLFLFRVFTILLPKFLISLKHSTKTFTVTYNIFALQNVFVLFLIRVLKSVANSLRLFALCLRVFHLRVSFITLKYDVFSCCTSAASFFNFFFFFQINFLWVLMWTHMTFFWSNGTLFFQFWFWFWIDISIFVRNIFEVKYIYINCDEMFVKK